MAEKPQYIMYAEVACKARAAGRDMVSVRVGLLKSGDAMIECKSNWSPTRPPVHIPGYKP